MSLRRLFIIAAAVAILSLVAYTATGYFSTPSSIKRLTGWTLPEGAVLRTKKVDGDPFNGERNYLFDLPGSALAADAYCASLNLPATGPGAPPKVNIPIGKIVPPKLEAEAVCSRTEINTRRKTALSIEATRKALVIRWIYM